MASKASYLTGVLAVATVMIGALPVAQGIGASTKELPLVQVNRVAKGDRIVEQRTIAVKKPTETARDIIKNPVPKVKLRIMDGCEPVFSAVTVPALAHIAGRCVG